MARINTASQRTFAHNALLAPAIGACAIVVAPPADHPVVARRAMTGTDLCPPKQRERAQNARATVRTDDRPRLWHWSQAFKFHSRALKVRDA